jgi:hypothetical protein
LVTEVEAAGGVCALWLNLASKARLPIQCAWLDEAASLAVAVFIIGVAVKFSLPKTTDRLLRNVWKLACYAGFLTGREASRRMLPHARGSIFFTGATASVRGDDSYAAFAIAKFGRRAAVQNITRELSPRSIHVAHLVIDKGVATGWVRQRITAAGRWRRIAS